MRYTLITGASAGIGEALAKKLAAAKHNLILIARNTEKLATISKDLKGKYGVEIEYITADLSRPGAAREIFNQTQKQGWQIDTLINNAGIGSGGEFVAMSLQSELDLLQLNNASLIAMTHLFIQPMLTSKQGSIINVSSMASFMPVPYMATYAASKAFVRSFTQALSEECKPYDIFVMLFSPGLTKTNFNHAAGIDNEKGVGLSSDYETSATQTPDEVAQELMDTLQAKKYFHISGSKNRLGARILALVPNSMIARFVAGTYRKKSLKYN